MKKVKVELHPQTYEFLAADFKAGKRCSLDIGSMIVEVTVKGKKFTRSQATGPDAFAPMTDEELKQKFRDNASYSPFDTDKVERLIETIYKLDKLDNVVDIGLTLD